MQEVTGNIWDFADKGWIVIPTNGVVNYHGDAIMGAGLAKEAVKRFPDLPLDLGKRLRESGNHNYHFMSCKIMTFPTKYHWKDRSDINLIIQSAIELQNDLRTQRNQGKNVQYFLPKVGCGLGGLNWEDVKKEVAPYLDNHMITFII